MNADKLVVALLAAVILAALMVGSCPAQMPRVMINTDSTVVLDSIVANQYHPLDYGYDKKWTEIQACAGITSKKTVLDYAWVMVPAHGFYVHERPAPDAEDRLPYLGYAAVEKGNIAIIGRLITSDRTPKHEMLHMLLYESDKPYKHPEADSVFTRCEVM
jgi:hypothetical protein